MLHGTVFRPLHLHPAIPPSSHIFTDSVMHSRPRHCRTGTKTFIVLYCVVLHCIIGPHFQLFPRRLDTVSGVLAFPLPVGTHGTRQSGGDGASSASDEAELFGGVVADIAERCPRRCHHVPQTQSVSHTPAINPL